MSFRNLLGKIYGRDITNGLIENNIDEFRSKREIRNAVKEYGIKYGLTKRETKCVKCTTPRHQDFPGWVGSLKYNKDGKIINKDIIIFGREISDEGSVKKVLKNEYKVVWSNIHIWYDFGYFTTATELINSPYNDLFKNLSLFIDLKNEDILNRIYGTDIGKCFTEKKHHYKTWKNCSEEFLLKELNFFNEERLIFIFQGKKIKTFMKRYFRFLPDTEFLQYFDKNNWSLETFGITADQQGDFNIEVGSFYSRNRAKQVKKGNYLLIPHSSGQTKGKWAELKRNQKNLTTVISKIEDYLKLS